MATLVVVAGGVVGGPSPVAVQANPAGPSLIGLPAGFSSWGQLFDVQQRLDDAATRIEDAANATTGSGFTNVWVDAATNSLTLYWRGGPTATENEVINGVRGRGIRVTLVPAKYSRSQLDSQVALIQRDAAGSGAERVSHITKQPDGSGVQVGVRRTARDSAHPDASSTMAPGQLGKSLPHLQMAMNNGGVTIVAATNPPVELTREADRRPYWGGALVRRPQDPADARCSTGFAVHWPYDGQDYLTTAGHCHGVWHSWYTGDWISMGLGTPGNAPYDLMFIRTWEASAGRIYVGPGVGQPGQFSSPVWRASHTHDGDWLCVSGAITGWACSIRATGDTFFCEGTIYPGVCKPMEGGISSVGQLIVGESDSGGPVWVPINGIGQWNSAVDARGSISVGVSGPCVGCRAELCAKPLLLGGGLRWCFTALWFTDILDAIRPWAATGMYVKTG